MQNNKPSLNQEVSKLHHIAEKLKPTLKKMGIFTIHDLLWYFPFRYDDLSQIKKIEELEEGALTTIQVKIDKIKSYRSWRKKMIITEIKASDDTGQIQAMWFRQKFVSKILKVGDEVYLSAKAKQKNNSWQMLSPEYEKIKENPLHSARLVPIYHLSQKISQKQLRFLINKALELDLSIDDPLPVDILNKEKYPWLHESLQEIHFPDDEKKLKLASNRLKFQELFYLQCKYQMAKNDYQAQSSYQIKTNEHFLQKQFTRLPFQLTVDQNTSLYEILADISKKSPMNRLLEGDVGSGKTIVAMLSAISACSQDMQVAFMAPTEILAQQHFLNALKYVPENLKSKTALFTKSFQQIGEDKISNKTELTKKIKQGEVKLIIGTHSLIQDKINFDKLALVIIDEQHRFGVKQRQSLKNKNSAGQVPHLLSMTATPIPRTLSLTLYGDLDISLIKEKPGKRKAIKTFLVPETKRSAAYDFINKNIKKGQQAFVICPLIDDSDILGVKSVTAEYKKLNDKIFPHLEIAMLHGKLKAQEKQDIMTRFQNNEFPILVSTSVVEVGVDIPNATLMMIESAERFGLSQLHQFRGRIGRNDIDNFCMLFVTDKSKLNTQRLQALSKSNDGFELAELDLALRGAGEIFGTKQTGLMKLKIAKLSDTSLIKKAQIWAKIIMTDKKYLSQKTLQKTLKSLKTEMHLE